MTAISAVLRARTSGPSLSALILITGAATLTTDTYIAGLPQVQASLSTTARARTPRAPCDRNA